MNIQTIPHQTSLKIWWWYSFTSVHDNTSVIKRVQMFRLFFPKICVITMFWLHSLFFKICLLVIKMDIIYFLLGYTKVQFSIYCPESSNYTNEDLETLRQVLKNFTNAEDEDILLTGVKMGSIIVIFMIRTDVIPQIRKLFMSELYQMLQSLKYKIMEVVIEDEVIYSGMYNVINFLLYSK